MKNFKTKFSFLFLLISFTSLASMDFKIGTQFRSYPSFGGEFFFNTGYNILLWGSDPGAEKTNPLYGLLRPSLNGATSFVVNNINPQIEFYPISFIGLIAGKNYFTSNFDFPFFDCEEVNCKGRFNHDFTKIKLGLALWKINFLGSITNSKISYENDFGVSKEDKEDLPFADFRRALKVDPTSDTQIAKKMILGFKIDNENLIGHLYDDATYNDSDVRSTLKVFLYQKKYGTKDFTIGAGTMQTTYLNDENFILVFKWSYALAPSKALF